MMSREPNPRQHPNEPPSPPPRSDADGDWRIHLGIIGALAAVTALLYSPSLHAPWYMDDFGAITENALIRDLGASFRRIFLPRGIAIFSFALNYRLGGIYPFGYHLVNLGLHLCCSVLVFLLLRRVARESALFPALGALLFAAHPLQTQAVTYVVQRMAVLAALFFLLALWLFARAREQLADNASFASGRHIGYYLSALTAGLCAVLTKENTAVLPVALYLYVTFFLPPTKDRRRLLLSLLPFAAGPLVLAAVRLLLPIVSGKTLAEITSTTHLMVSPHFTPLHYLVTEFSALWVYIRMLFVPYGQALHHSYPVVVDLLDLRHLVAGGGLVLLGVLAVWLRRRQPLIAAGIAWFFLTLAVESSFIPLDPLFEHRLYLPMFGFVLVLFGLLRLLPGNRTGVAVLTVAVLLCLPLTWQRNCLWANPIAFYRDNLAKVPHSASVLSDLAGRYVDAARFAEAEPLLLQALEHNPDLLAAYINLLEVYSGQGRLPEALALVRRGLEIYPSSEALLIALGNLYYDGGDLAQALQIFNQVMALNPDNHVVQANRANVFALMEHWEEAEADFRQALAFNTSDVKLLIGLAVSLKMQGKTQEAEAELLRSIEIDPGNRNALFHLGLLAIDRGEQAQAASLAQRLRRSDPQAALELEQLIRNDH